MKLVKSMSFLALILAISAAFMGCADNNEATREGQTVIDGNVEVEGSFDENILVIALQNGAQVDSADADDEGDFQLAVPRGGDVTLRFETSAFTALTSISVTPDSDVTLDLSILPLDPPEVEINTFEIVSVPIRITESEEFIFNEELADLTIEGRGRDCIRATGNSEVDIIVGDLTITDCDNGIVGEDFANVRLEAVTIPTLSVEADNNGIHAMDDSSIRLTGSDVFITGGMNGILATGTSGVEVDPSGDCEIEGGDEAVDERDLADVDTASCSLSVTR